MINSNQSDNQSRVQTILFLLVSLMVFASLYVGVRSYEERVAVQAVRLAVEHRVENIDFEQAGQAKDIDTLWAVYGPQSELTEDEFYSLADPIVDSHHTLLPMFISVMGAGLTFVLLGMAMNMTGRQRAFHKAIEHKDIELQHSRQQLAAATTTDELTGLSNERYFRLQLDIECRRAVREFNPLTLMLLEIDATPGADALIIEQQINHVAELVNKGTSRPGDLIARISNTRFALLLPATNEQSPQLAERLCREAGEITIAGLPLSISMGISTMQPSAQLTAELILHQTEDALSKAQANGGGQVIAFTEEPRDIPVTYSN